MPAGRQEALSRDPADPVVLGDAARVYEGGTSQLRASFASCHQGRQASLKQEIPHVPVLPGSRPACNAALRPHSAVEPLVATQAAVLGRMSQPLPLHVYDALLCRWLRQCRQLSCGGRIVALC